MLEELVILGAGASGLMAANAAAVVLKKTGLSPLVLEGNPKAGKKLLATGNGRCNLTNLSINPAHYHGDALASKVLEKFPARRILKKFENLGLLCRADGEGRAYPRGAQAAAVLEALRRPRVFREICGFEAVSVKKTGDGFLLESRSGETVKARRLILACGGAASPKHSSGTGYGLARSLGHGVTALTPSLAPLKTPSKACGLLKGMRVRAGAHLYRDGKEVYAESGEVLFGERQLSGICIFNLSARLRETGVNGIEVGLDLLEELSVPAAADYFQALRKEYPQLPASQLFSGVMNLRVGQELGKQLGFYKDRPLSALTQGDLRRAAARAKDWRFPVSGPGAWEDAQVTAGGVPLSEICLDTLESKKCLGLYLVGELLDVDGDCGGYNLHWAWSTGILAGEAAARASLTGR